MKYLLTIFFSFYLLMGNSQNTFNIRPSFSFEAPSLLTNVIPTDSCYYAMGIIRDTASTASFISSLFVKFDLDGNFIYDKILSSSERTYEVWSNSLIAKDNKFFVAGESRGFGFTTRAIFFKLNNQGDTLLTQDYFNPQYPQCPDATFINVQDFKPTFDNGFVFTGYTVKKCPTFNADIHLVKLDSMGNTEWFNTYGNGRRDIGMSLIVKENGSIIVGAVKTNTDEVTENYLWQTHIFQVDSLGNEEWTYLSPPDVQRDGAKEMVLLDDGSLIVASGIGYEQERASVNDMWFEKSVFKLNPDHELEWEKEFKDATLGPTTYTTNIIALSDNSGVVITGTDTYNPPVSWIYQKTGWIMKMDLAGDTLWSRRYVYPISQNSRHQFFDIKETPDGGFILCGESINAEDNVEIPQQSWLLKLDDHGCLLPGCYTATEEVENGQLPFKISIYPNPTTDYLNIYHYFSEADFWQNGQYRIVDSQGREVAAFPIGQNDVTMVVPVWEWAKGVYFLQLVVADGVVKTEKFVVQ
jgi:hypothetical protein